MGLKKEMPTWNEAESLPEIMDTEPTADILKAMALDQRGDLAMAKQELEIQKQGVAALAWSGVGDAKAGFKIESEPEAKQFMGPSVEFSIPLFQATQSAVSKQEAMVRQTQFQLEAKELDIRSEVTLAYGHLMASRKKGLSIRDNILPLKTKLVDLTQKHYNYMLLGVFSVIQAKQNEVAAQQLYVEALKEYWIARAELERALGAKLPGARGTISKEPQAATPSANLMPQ